jgi:1-acyl-sn-glycerol-3-phosphate acyltransferase
MGYPLLGRILQTLEPVTVTRGDPRADLKKVLTGGEEQLRKGRSVVIFPQTTRSTGFDPSAFNTLGVKLAARVGVPAMPLALRTDFWSPGRFIKDFGPIRPNNNIHFAFGPPLEVTKATARSAHEQVVAFLRTHLSSWGVPVN